MKVDLVVSWENSAIKDFMSGVHASFARPELAGGEVTSLVLVISLRAEGGVFSSFRRDATVGKSVPLPINVISIR